MPARWTKEQLLVAIGLYCKLPFGQLHSGNPEIIHAASGIGRTAGALAMKLCNLASLDPVITESGRHGLRGASAQDRELWAEFANNPDAVIPEAESALATLNAISGADHQTDEPTGDRRNHSADDPYKLAKQRRGQHLFRAAVLSSYDYRCCITGVEDTRLLVASHILPWAQNEENRLNPHNGLCLSTLYDRAFDIGLISLTDDFRLLISSQLDDQSANDHIRKSFLDRKNQPVSVPKKFHPSNNFIAWHRDHLFRA